MKTLYVIGFVVLVLATSSASSVPSGVRTSFTSQSVGKVKGTVIDPNGAVLLNATVTIKGERAKREVTTDVNGVYEAEVPAGVYESSTEIPGWYPLRRAKFYVQPNTTTTITLAPALRVASIGLEVTASGTREPVETLPPPQYDFFSPPCSQNTQLDVVVQYLKKRTQRGNIEYDRATASYDTLTISAARLRLDPKTLHIEAEGNVVVEDDRQRVQVKRAEIEFRAGKSAVRVIR